MLMADVVKYNKICNLPFLNHICKIFEPLNIDVRPWQDP